METSHPVLLIEESYFLRFCHLIQTLAPEAVRHRFDQEFPPNDLDSIIQEKRAILQNLRFMKVITTKHFNLMFPSGSLPTSSSFDITLMLCLFRNLTRISPISGDYDSLPPDSDITLGGDLARIKYYRNKIAHDRKIDKHDFPIVWDNVSKAIGRIGGVWYEQECSNLRIANLDSSYQEIHHQMKQEISDLIEKNKKQENEIKKLQNEQKDPVAPKAVDLKDSAIPEAIMNMDDRSIEMYKSMLMNGSEKRRDIRIMLLGKKGSGKTTLVKRLLRKDLADVTKTNGAEIHIKKCRIRCKDGLWENPEDCPSSISSRLKREFIEFVTNAQPTSHSEKTDEENSFILEDVTDDMIGVSKSHESLLQVHSFPQDEELKRCSDQTNQSIPETFPEVLKTKHTTDEFVNVYIWDFAGDEEFYNTHQMFFAREVIYLVLTNLTENNSDQHDALQFWFDSVHLLYNEIRNGNGIILQRNPPVLVVGTHTDLFEGDETLWSEHLKEQICGIQPAELRCHIRDHALISNTKDNEETFDKLRETILGIVKQGSFWNKELPIKFILLEDKLEKVKLSKTFLLSFDEILNIAKETDQPISEREQIDLFLRFHHEIGNVIYFDDIPEYVILNPQWLIDIYKSIVTADLFKLNYFWADWDEVTNTGRLDKQLLDDIMSKYIQDGIYTDYLLKVLEKCDIIVRPRTLSDHESSDKRQDYYVPCMVKTAVPHDIVKKFEMYLTHKSSILCLDCSFLPPVIFNQLLIACCRKSEWSVAAIEIEGRKQLAFFRNLAVFDLSANGCKKLVLSKYRNVIQLQIWNFGKVLTPSGDIRSFIVDQIQRIASERIRVNKITFTVKIRCPDSRFDSIDGMINYDKMEKEPLNNEYFCSIHTRHHEFNEEWCGSSRVLHSGQLNFARMGIITLDVLGDALFDLLRKDFPSEKDRSRYDVSSLYQKHRTNNKYIPSSGKWDGINGQFVDDVHPNFTKIGDDIERTRLIRNEMQHSKTFSLTNQRTDQLYNFVTAILTRFDKHINPTGKSYVSRAKEVNVMTVTCYEMKKLQSTLSYEAHIGYQKMLISTIVVLGIAFLVNCFIL